MRKTLAVVGIAAVAMTGSAHAGSVSGNAAFDGATAPNVDGPIVMLDITVALPAITSLDSVDLALASTYGSDVHVALVAPDATIYTLAHGQGTTLGATPYDMFGPFDGGFNSQQLGVTGAGVGTLANVLNYNLSASGPAWLSSGASGAYAAVNMPVGSFAAGDWRLVVLDVWPSVDISSLGQWSINYTAIPAPGALALLGLAGLAGTSRRRRA